MIAATAATATTASAVVILMSRSVTGLVPDAAGFSVSRLESCYELGKLSVGDAAQLADLDAAELARAEKVVHLVPPDVEEFCYLFHRVCLQESSPPPDVSRCVVVSAFVLPVGMRIDVQTRVRRETRQPVR